MTRRRMTSGTVAGPRGDRGSMAVEIVLIVPVLMLILMLIVMLGRYVAVRGDIQAAARDAARAGSFEQSEDAAYAAARQMVSASLDHGTTCDAPTFGGTYWGAPVGGGSGQFVVHLRCQVSWSGLAPLGKHGSQEIQTTATVPLDPHRTY